MSDEERKRLAEGEHYQINGTATNGIHVRQNEDLLEKDFNEISKVSTPKIISFNEAKEAGITDHKTRYPKIFGDV